MMIRPYLHNAKYYETDQMGIIHHSNYIRWFEEARIDYMNQIGLTYKKMMYFDDLAIIEVKITKYTGVRFACEYKIYNQKHTLCTTGNSNHCFTDRSGRPINLKKIKPDFDRLFKKIIE